MSLCAGWAIRISSPPWGELRETVGEIFSQDLYRLVTWIPLPITRVRHDESGGSSARSRRFQLLEADDIYAARHEV